MSEETTEFFSALELKMSKAKKSKRSVLDERYKCSVCNELFGDNSKLSTHMDTHSETKQLMCTICKKTFSTGQEGDLDKHYLLHRMLMQPFGCPGCESRFETQDQMLTHVESTHSSLTIGGNSEQQQTTETASTRKTRAKQQQEAAKPSTSKKSEAKEQPQSPKMSSTRKLRAKQQQSTTEPSASKEQVQQQKHPDSASTRKPGTKQQQKTAEPSSSQKSEQEQQQKTSVSASTRKKLEATQQQQTTETAPEQQQTPESETSRRSSPRSLGKTQSKIKDFIAAMEKPKKEQVKSPEKSFPEPAPLTAKKSILKTAPTPSGKKRPLVWKDPIVSPEKKNVAPIRYQQSPSPEKKNVALVQLKQSPSPEKKNIVSVQVKTGEKRKLASAPLAIPSAKKVKVCLGPMGESVADDAKFATPVRKTPITKTKLMQNISKLYNTEAPMEKKTLEQTRKDIRNALTITPVTKGPIRVSKRDTQPFITMYSPSKNQSESANESKRNIVHSSTSSFKVVQGKTNEGEQDVKPVVESSRDFDKLLSKTTPCVIETSDVKKMQAVVNIATKQISGTKESLMPMKLPSLPAGLTIEATSSSKSTTPKSEKSVKNAVKCGCVSPPKENKILKLPAGKLPHIIKFISQSPLPKAVSASPPQKIISPAISTETTCVKLEMSPKSATGGIHATIVGSPANKTEIKCLTLAVSPKSATSGVHPTRVSSPADKTEINSLTLAVNSKSTVGGMRPTIKKIESEPEIECLSERDIHRDSLQKHKKLRILLPTISLERFSGVKRAIDPRLRNRVPLFVRRLRAEAEAAKRAEKPDEVVDPQLEKDNSPISKLECLPGEEAVGVGTRSTSKISNVQLDKSPNKPSSPEKNSIQEQPKLETMGTKTRGKLLLSGNKDVSPVASQIIKYANFPPAGKICCLPYKVPTRNAKSVQPEANLPEKPSNIKTRRKNRCESQVSKSVVTDPPIVEETISPEPTRRSKRMLEKKESVQAEEKRSPRGLKKGKSTIQQRKEVLKKTPEVSILKSVIDKEVSIIESMETSTDNAPQNTSASSSSPANPQPPNKVKVVALSPEVMKRLKETFLKQTSGSTPKHIRLVVSSQVLSRMQNSTGNAAAASSSSTPPNADPTSSLKVSEVPPKSEVFRYGIEDLKRDQRRKKDEQKKMEEKEIILKKMLDKFDEKEKKKHMKFCEKKLARFLEKHQESHVEILSERLSNIRNLPLDEGIVLFEEVKALHCVRCREVIGKTLCSLGFGNKKDLSLPDKGVEGLVALTTSKVKQRVSRTAAAEERKTRLYNRKFPAAKSSPVKESTPSSKRDQIGFSVIECAPNLGGLSYSNDDSKKLTAKRNILSRMNTYSNEARGAKYQKSKKFVGDPFADANIITQEKFVMECPCSKPNCNGLHPENFLAFQ